jgi:hypothetical protein
MDTKTAEKPVEIRVAQGIYRPDRSAAHPEGTSDRSATFRLLDEVTIRGGFAGLGALDPNARDLELYRTVLSGDLAGDDVPLASPMGPRYDPSRADNCDHVVSYNEDVTRMLMTDLTAELDGLAVTGGRAFHFKTSGNPPIPTDAHCGGGLFIRVYHKAVGAVTIRNCTFEDNYAEEWGGAVYCSFANHLVMEGCTVVRNASRGCGAGLSIREGDAKLSSCRIDHNWAELDGGAAFLNGCSVVFTRCSISQNRAQTGGGLFRSGGPAAELIDCLLRENVASGSGGAILDDGTIKSSNCTFLGNRAAYGGVVLMNGSRTVAMLSNCLLAGNAADETGGVVWTRNAEVELLNCTMSANRAPKGRLILESTCANTVTLPRGRVHLINCIVSDGGDEIWNDYGEVTIQYTDLLGGQKAVHDLGGAITWGPGNVDADPCFADPGYWDPNGTPEDPNDDFFVEGDYHLKSQAGRWDPAAGSWVVDDVTSPCIDAGDPNSPVGEEPFPNGGRVNLGAYGGTAEASMSYLIGAKVIYVDDDAPAPGDGSSWQTAYKYLQDALADALTLLKPVEIRVAQGVYRPDEGHSVIKGNKKAVFTLIDDVSIMGGFGGVHGTDPNTRDVDAYATILSGDLLVNDIWADVIVDVPSSVAETHSDNSECIVDGSNTGPTAVLDGFRIEGATSFPSTTATQVRQGGLYVNSGCPSVNLCLFTRNLAPGVRNENVGQPALTKCGFAFNRSPEGAGISSTMGNLSVTQCLFENNSAAVGSGVSSRMGDITIRDSVFVHNVAIQKGGAVFNLGGILHAKGCEFRMNTVAWSGSAMGGAVYADGSSDLILDDCTFGYNSSSGVGGAVCVRGGELMIGKCRFHSNKSGDAGGGISANDEVDVTITDSVFVANQARAGGAVFGMTKGLQFQGCILAGNRCREWGGAVYFGGSAGVKLDRCSLQGNHADGGQGSALYSGLSNIEIKNSIIWDINAIKAFDSGRLSIMYSDLYDPWHGGGNISADPGFVQNGYWDPNGTPDDPNDDFFVEGDYHLKSQAGRWDPAAGSWVVDDVTSPCIDAGDPNSPVGEEPFPNGGRVNLGAYGGTAEASMPYVDGPAGTTVVAGDINGAGRVDFADWQILALHWLEKGRVVSTAEHGIGK